MNSTRRTDLVRRKRSGEFRRRRNDDRGERMTIPPYEPPPVPGAPPSTTNMRCPKCQGSMRTYERNGIHLEQCDTCRGIFLDFGELEALTQMESRFVQAPPVSPPPQPGY